MDFPNKIDLIMKTLKVNQVGLANMLGVSRGIISEFASGAREPSKDFLFGISRLGVSLDWFLTGNGEMFIKSVTVTDLKTETVSDLKNETVSDLKSCTVHDLKPEETSPEGQILHNAKFETGDQKPHGAVFEPGQPPALEAKSPAAAYALQGRKGLQVLSPRHLKQPRNLELYKYKKGKGEPVSTQISTVDPEAVAFIPVFGQRAAAGPGQEPTQLEETEGLVPIIYDLFGLHRPESCGIVKVVGDSMSDISLFNGDWCVFDRVDIQGDGIFVISMFGEMRVKRLQYRLSDRKIIIASENKKRYPEPEVISAEVAISGQLTIHGRVFAWFHKHPY